MKFPPVSKEHLTHPAVLCERLAPVIGQPFALTKKSRTDGSNLRKRIEAILNDSALPAPAPEGSYEIVPPKKKGVPKLRREFLDSYIVTSGQSYNLQVWNRNPAADSVQIQYKDGSALLATDVRFVFGKVGDSQQIESFAVLSPDYIIRNFGKFGKPTIKHQMLISDIKRRTIEAEPQAISFRPDHPRIADWTTDRIRTEGLSIHHPPVPGNILSLEGIRDQVAAKLIGVRLDDLPTKNRGQALEVLVSGLLGYDSGLTALLAGGYPDVRNQALEVKVQDSQTVDLGKYSPQFEEELEGCPGFTTSTMRYLIALTDRTSGIITSIVLSPGYKLGEQFTYVSDTSFKCQRSIPMSFFESFKGRAVYNP